MSANIEYIDDYFQKQLNAKQKEEFEARCLSDENFAEEVALYISTRRVLDDQLLREKKLQWSGLPPSESNVDKTLTTDATGPRPGVAPVRKAWTRNWITYAAAACLISFMLIYSLTTGDSAKQLVHEYVENNLTISNTMDASRDSMQAGITAYKNKNYEQAIQTFSSLYGSDTVNQQTLQYLGQAQLMNRNYDAALNLFQQLSQRQLRSNAGPFLMGITLMERDQPGDAKEAKRLFEKVVRENLEGKPQAELWLKKME